MMEEKEKIRGYAPRGSVDSTSTVSRPQEMSNPRREEESWISQYSIPLKKRTTHNNTHVNLVDESIYRIIPYRISNCKFSCALVLYFLSLGIVYICARMFSRFYIFLNCCPCELKEADFFVIIDFQKDYHMVEALYENFYKRNTLLAAYYSFTTNNKGIKASMENSSYVGDDYKSSREDSLVIYYNHNKYVYNEVNHYFEPARLDLTKFTNREILFNLKDGIVNGLDLNYLLNKFGPNKLALEGTSYFVIFFKQLIHPFYLYQVFSIIIWILENYYKFPIIVIVAASVSVLINTYQTYQNKKRVLNFSNVSSGKIIRTIRDDGENFDLSHGLESLNTGAENIVPGDVIQLSTGDIVPCDCVLLDGFCTVNEADLTGESSLVMKTRLPCSEQKFDYALSQTSILSTGTRVDQCESFDPDIKGIRALAINTGFNTQRGNMIQNILFPRQTNFKLFKEIVSFFGWMLMIFIVAVYLLVSITNKNEAQMEELMEEEDIPYLDNTTFKALVILTIIFPPTLPICMTFGSFYFHFLLNTKNISCVSEYRMNAAGRVNVILLDKTGTLTEEGLDLYGYQTTRSKSDHGINKFNTGSKEYFENSPSSDNMKKPSSCHVEFDELEKEAKVYNFILQEFYRKLYHENLRSEYPNTAYQTDPKNNIIYFVECLATCHSIDKLNGNYFGNSIDKKIFDNLKWNLYKSGEYGDEIKLDVDKAQMPVRRHNVDTTTFNEDNKIKYDMIPKKYYQITEEEFFRGENTQHKAVKTYKLAIIKRFEFASKYQAMSVIVSNNFDGSFRYFIKGAPEKIFILCRKESIPDNFEEQLIQHTNNGFRVLACATKLLSKVAESVYETELDRSKFECDLTFLGFIIFKNKLKIDTKHVIGKLISGGSKLVMSTGDNPFTSISVGRECELVEKDSMIYLIDSAFEHEPTEKRGLLKFSCLNKDLSELRSGSIVIPGDMNPFPDGSQSDKTERRFLESHRKSSIGANSPYANAIHKKWEITSIMEFLDIINAVEKNFVLCISGTAFRSAIQQFNLLDNALSIDSNERKSEITYTHTELSELLNLIRVKAKIFYRMSPSTKVDLVDFFKEDKQNIVAMCGDGANDCGALLSADVGIAIKHLGGANITSHFQCLDESINSVEVIIKIGRACFENSVIIFEYIIMYAVIELTAMLILYYNVDDMTNSQYLFIDCGIVLVVSILISRTGPNLKKLNDEPNKSIINLKFIFSTFGQVCIQIAWQIGLFFTLYPNGVVPSNPQSPEDVYLDVLNSYYFLICVFQCAACIFTFNYFSQHKKKCYSNKTFIVYIVWLVFFGISLMTIDYFQDYANSWSLVYLNANENSDENSSQKNRLITIGYSVMSGLITFGYEALMNYLFNKT